MIHYYYGYGKGKTCSAIGAAMRAYGAGMSVLLVQFFKNDKSSELGVLPFMVFKAPHHLDFNPDNSYAEWVTVAINEVMSTTADVIILDEFSDLVPKFLSADTAIQLLSADKEFIITGHNRVDELYELADYATFFQKEKHPYDNGITARLGIEY